MAGLNGMSAHGVERMLPPEYADRLRAAEDVAAEVTRHAALIAGNVNDVSARLTGAARSQLREKPGRTLLAAVAAGFVLGVLWRS